VRCDQRDDPEARGSSRAPAGEQYIATDIDPPRPQTSTTAAAQGACGEALSLLRFGSATSVSRIVSWRGQNVGQNFMSAEAAERRAMLLQHLGERLFAAPRGALSPQEASLKGTPPAPGGECSGEAASSAAAPPAGGSPRAKPSDRLPDGSLPSSHDHTAGRQ